MFIQRKSALCKSYWQLIAVIGFVMYSFSCKVSIHIPPKELLVLIYIESLSKENSISPIWISCQGFPTKHINPNYHDVIPGFLDVKKEH